MLEQLFGSKTRIRLLRLFFRNTERSFFVREMSRELGVQINAVRRELDLLVQSTLVIETDAPGDVNKAKAGAQLRKYYRVNPGSLIYPEMQALLLKSEVLNEQQFVEKLKEKAGDIKLLLLTGRFVNDKEVESDMLLIGKIKQRVVGKIIEEYEKESGCDVRYTIMTEQEFFERRQMMDKFIFALFESKKMMIVNLLEL